MQITFIATGGTIDKDYASHAGTYNFEITSPSIKRVLKNIDVNFKFEIISILKKDSLDLNDKDRELIYKTCKKIKHDKIIITHGTDTMVKTAHELSKLKNKTIVIVGAVKPEKFKDSDAPINIGVAIGAINVLKKGIYIAMNGRV
jgi:L-asparaginase